MSETDMKADAGGDPKSALDLIEEALVGTHQEVPGSSGSEIGSNSEATDDDKPPVPGHRSP